MDKERNKQTINVCASVYVHTDSCTWITGNGCISTDIHNVILHMYVVCMYVGIPSLSGEKST